MLATIIFIIQPSPTQYEPSSTFINNIIVHRKYPTYKPPLTTNTNQYHHEPSSTFRKIINHFNHHYPPLWTTISQYQSSPLNQSFSTKVNHELVSLSIINHHSPSVSPMAQYQQHHFHHAKTKHTGGSCQAVLHPGLAEAPAPWIDGKRWCGWLLVRMVVVIWLANGRLMDGK